jgi:hypothetical protein
VHHAALPIDETPGFIQILRREETVVARAFEFCILNATRTNETKGAGTSMANRLSSGPSPASA